MGAADREQGATPSRRPASLGLAAALVALTLAAYAGVTALGFVDFDDPQYVTANEAVLRGLTPEGLRYAFTSTAMGNWHPLTWLSHMLVVQLAGAEPPAHHIANLALHLVSVLLLFWLLLRTTGRRWPSALAAALFAVHPLHVESVAWVAERKDVLSTVFWLLALHAWVGWARTREVRWYAATALAFVAGLMSKPMLVTLPFTLLLLDVWPLGRWRGTGAPGGQTLGRLLLEKVPLLALTAVWSWITLFAQRREGAMEFGDTIPPGLRAANAVRSVGVYLLQTLWPADLAIWYPYPEPLPAAQVALAAVAIVAVSGLCLVAWRRAPWATVGWLWFLGTLVPVLGLVQVGNQAHADRYTYVPHLGLFAALAWGAASLVRGPAVRRGLVAAGAAVVLAACILATAAQVRTWRDDESVFAQAIAATGGNTLAHDKLGHLRQLQGRPEEAVEHYREVLRARPTLATAHVNLGTALQQQGDLVGARASYRRALELDPETANAWSNLGVLLAGEGRHQEAEEHFARSLERSPRKAGVLVAAALNDLGRGDRRSAASRFRRAAGLDPGSLDHPEALRLAWALATDADPAVRDGELARRVAQRRVDRGGGRDPAVLEVLAAALAACGEFDRARETAERALALLGADAPPATAARLEQARELYASGRAVHVR